MGLEGRRGAVRQRVIGVFRKVFFFEFFFVSRDNVFLLNEDAKEKRPWKCLQQNLGVGWKGVVDSGRRRESKLFDNEKTEKK